MRFRDIQLPASEPEPAGILTRAAVALVIGPEDHLLLIQRAEREGDPWSGHMAFPGGRQHPEDTSLTATAIRETQEEVGLDLAPARYLGALPVHLSPIREPVPSFGIFPFVFAVPSWGELKPAAAEVAAIHLIDGRRLLGGADRGEFRYQGHGFDVILPCLRIDGTLIWGLTLRMLDEFGERLQR